MAFNGFSQQKADSVVSQTSDSIFNEDEEAFQTGLDTLFSGNQYFDLDTSHWDNRMINFGHFDSGNWKDTARIVLVDSATKKYYSPPFVNYLTCNFG